MNYPLVGRMSAENHLPVTQLTQLEIDIIRICTVRDNIYGDGIKTCGALRSVVARIIAECAGNPSLELAWRKFPCDAFDNVGN